MHCLDRVGVVVVLAAASAMPAHAQLSTAERAARDADERFLAEAEIVASHQLSAEEGITEPYKLTLSDGTTTRHAVWKNPDHRINGQLDSWRYEVAAYRLDRYLGADMVPTTVERTFRSSRGSCQAWITHWKLLRDIVHEKIPTPPEHVHAHNRAVYLQRAFDNLIANIDRHLGNILVTEDWRLVLIDHSRAFRVGKRFERKLLFTEKHREGPKPMRELPRAWVERLEALDAAKLDELVGDYLTAREKEGVLARRVLILEAVRARIDELGVDQVLYDLPPR